MLSSQDLIKKILSYNPRADVKLIEKAYSFAQEAHKGQLRESGYDYFIHPLSVTEILTDMMADSATICAALLHDTLEDTKVTVATIEKEFGKEIRSMVEAVTKLKKIDFKEKSDYTASNLRKIILASTKDVRVLLIKLADKLHNMRTLDVCSPEKQKRTSLEVEKIYGPIAHKLGMMTIQGELEDLALKYLNPDVYQELRRRIFYKREEREKEAEHIRNTIEELLRKRDIKAKVFGRVKYLSSIYKKMVKKNLDFNEIYDLIAFRVITDTIPECYTVLGLLHELFKPIPGKFKDYISLPKANGYKSLHTKVVSEKGRILEFQIRTWDMHYQAEYGIAAHWRYKENERDKAFDQKISWLKEIMDWKQQSSTAKDFVETLRIDLFKDEIVVFTPKGDPISLPEGSTPIDFAYAVHTSVGNSAKQAKVNSRIMPLDTALSSGDIVEVVTHKNAVPSRQWLKFAKTNRARSKIRAALHMPPEKGSPPSESLLTAKLSSVSELIVHDSKHHDAKLAKCCEPKPGDKIIGLLTKDRKVSVHKSDCPNIHSQKETRTVKVSWKKPEKTNQYEFLLVVEDRIGLLLDVLNVLSSHQINVLSVHTKRQKGRVHVVLELEIPDAVQVQTLLGILEKLEDVVDVKVKQQGAFLSKNDILERIKSAFTFQSQNK